VLLFRPTLKIIHSKISYSIYCKKKIIIIIIKSDSSDLPIIYHKKYGDKILEDDIVANMC